MKKYKVKVKTFEDLVDMASGVIDGGLIFDDTVWRFTKDMRSLAGTWIDVTEGENYHYEAKRFTFHESWLESIEEIEEIEEEVDWSKVPVDAKILVRNDDDEAWKKRHFAGYKDGKVCAFANGLTSWYTVGEAYCYSWNQAKLAE